MARRGCQRVAEAFGTPCPPLGSLIKSDRERERMKEGTGGHGRCWRGC